MKQVFASLAACLVLTACSTPTVYGPRASANASGFTEMRIEADRYRVSYQGGNGAGPDQVADYALLRAAEIASAQGYDWFRVVEQFTQGAGGGGPQLSVGGGSSSFGGRSAVGLGLGTSFDLSGGPKLVRNIEVKLGRGPKPADAYDAADVIRTVGPRAPGPRPAL